MRATPLIATAGHRSRPGEIVEARISPRTSETRDLCAELVKTMQKQQVLTFIAASYCQGKDIYTDFDVRYAVTAYSMKRVQGNYTVGIYDPEAAWRNFDYVTSGATDSAAAANVLSSGRKIYNGALSMVLGYAQVSGTLQEKRSGDKTTPAYTDAPIENVPDLAIMTRSAMNVLSQNRNDFFVHIEGGAVDWAR